MNFFPAFQSLLHSDLPCAQRMIMAVLLNHADAGGRAWPSQERIATQAGLGERAVRDHLHALVALGWLSITGHIGRNNIYRVSIPTKAAAADQQQPPNDRQEMPHDPADDRQTPPCEAADFSTQPADSAIQTGTFCRLTPHEPPTNHPLISHEKTGGPSAGEEMRSLPRVKKPQSHARAQPSKPNPKPKPVSKPGWREWNGTQAEEANTVAPAPHMPPDFHAAWQGWQAYRTRRATEARTASEAVRWTPDAAQAALRECERAANAHGWPAVIARIDQAIAGGWQGLNTDKIIPARPQFTAPPRDRSDTANRAGRYATPAPAHESTMSHGHRLPPIPCHPVHSIPAAIAPAAPATFTTDTAADAPVGAGDEPVSGSAYFFSQLGRPPRPQAPPHPSQPHRRVMEMS